MLDVHPPHEAAHTWKDFFIHIATIVVGLLIAVGLEQTVEYVHRMHERHLLEAELHVEAEILQRNAEIDIDQYDAFLKFLLALRKDSTILIAAHGTASLPTRQFVAPPMGHGVDSTGRIALLNPIWETARADGRLALLPEGIRRAYGVVSYEKTRIDADTRVQSESEGKLKAFSNQFSDIQTPRTPAISRMSEAQLIEYRALLTDTFEKTLGLRSVLVNMSGELNLVLKEEIADQRALSAADAKVLAAAHAAHRQDFARMADEIDAEDAARDKAAAKPARTAK